MCGRYYIADEEEIMEMREILKEVNQRYADRPERERMKTGEIFPTDLVPILAADQQDTRASLMTWGYPRWQGSGVVINARAETAAIKPLFSPSLAGRRCIVPANGFYEWDHATAGKKRKYLIRRPETPMLYMAGLYSAFKDPAGIYHTSFVILTTAANAAIMAIHDRMPLIVGPDQKEQWLHDEQYARVLLASPATPALQLMLAEV